MMSSKPVLLLALAGFVQTTANAQAPFFSIAATGDIMLGTNYPDDRLPPRDGADFLGAVAPVLQAADIAIGNLEGVIMEGGEPQKTCTNPQACFLFRSPPHYAGYLRDAGFNVLSLANNHARDFGEEGRTATMAVLDSYGLRHSGRHGDIASWLHQDLRVAFIAFSPTLESYLLNDIPVAVQEVAQLASAHDIVLVSFHGGAEGPAALELPFEEEFYYGETRGEVVRFAREVIDAGADLVIGHGPHVPRAMEIYRDRLIAYSLGNFATHFGVSVNGEAGLAPLLVANLHRDGRIASGRIYSAQQTRPNGPAWDPEQRGYSLIRRLTEATFGAAQFDFADDGSFFPEDDPAEISPQP
jgi:hypothetical protein